MKKMILACTLAAGLGMGCVSPGGAGGLLFNAYSGPFQATNNVSGQKIGEGSIICVLGLACFGDAGIGTAAKSADIKKVASVDYKYVSALGFVFTMTKVIVTGE
jgi:hypothetical protein